MGPKLVVTWDEVHRIVATLAHKYRSYNYNPMALLAVARGGWIPTSLLAYHLEMVSVAAIKIKSYNENNQRMRLDIEKQSFAWDRVNDPNYLFIDDICDSGATFLGIHQLAPKASFLALFGKPGGIARCQEHIGDRFIYGAEVPSDDTWVDFPWEQSFDLDPIAAPSGTMLN